MIAIDTNVVIQFITHDDETQWRAAESLIGNGRVFVPSSDFVRRAAEPDTCPVRAP